jgi:NAD-dependent deacetylase
MKHLVVLTGAGMSAESGIKTFRDSGGLWENYPVEDVASIEGWHRNPQLVLDFYNHRREELQKSEPNEGHRILAELEKEFKVSIVTQNVDNLHERAGSTNIVHLHGELTKACNETKTEVYDIAYSKINWGEKAEDGSQLRPFIVWFGEAVPLIDKAIELVESADILLIIGTSLKVYPAAGLLNYTKPNTPVYLIDPNEMNITNKQIHFIQKGASAGMRIFKEIIIP